MVVALVGLANRVLRIDHGVGGATVVRGHQEVEDANGGGAARGNVAAGAGDRITGVAVDVAAWTGVHKSRRRVFRVTLMSQAGNSVSVDCGHPNKEGPSHAVHRSRSCTRDRRQLTG